MMRAATLFAAFTLAAAGGSAHAQGLDATAPARPGADSPTTTGLPDAPPPAPETPPTSATTPDPAPVAVTTLAAPDSFSTAGRDTGLPADLWKGASLRTIQTVLPLLASKPLSPAAAALARRVLATGAAGPEGASHDLSLAGQRASGLLAQGDPKAAAAILARSPSIDRDPDLARAAAESALLAGDDARACAVAAGLGVGRDDVYWLRLRTYCQAIAGQAGQAQLTFDLAQAQGKDAIFGRLMEARISGTPAGKASLRNGLDYALSRSLSLDLASAKPAPGVAAALSGGDPTEPTWDLAGVDADIAGLGGTVGSGQPVPAGAVSALVGAAAEAQGGSKARMQSAALLIAALSPNLAADDRARVATFATPAGKVSAGRALALQDAAGQKLVGETALLALWTAAEAGAAGPAVADRAQIVHALAAVGLATDARAFAVEGLAALKAAP